MYCIHETRTLDLFDAQRQLLSSERTTLLRLAHVREVDLSSTLRSFPSDRI